MVPEWLKHAFAVDASLEPPTEEELRLVDRLVREVVRRRLTTPALALLEMSRPLNYLGSQAMHFLAPLMESLFDAEGYRACARFLERRDAIEFVCRRIEELEQSCDT